MALFAACVLVSAIAAVPPFWVQFLVQLLSAIDVLGAIQQAQIIPGKILINLRDSRFLRADRKNESWDVSATERLEGFQSVQTRNEPLVPSHGNRIEKTYFPDALNER